MITTAKAFVTSDQKTHATLEEAQVHEVDLLLQTNPEPEGVAPFDAQDRAAVAAFVVKQKDRLVDILTTTSTSKPRARKVNGGTKKRKAAPDPAAVNRELQDGKQ